MTAILDWQGRIPGHEILEILKESPGAKVVLRGRCGGEPCVTRVVASRVSAHFGPTVRELVLRGRGSPAGLPEDALLCLEGYRVAALAREAAGLPRVLDAGVLVPFSTSPTRDAEAAWNGGGIYLSTSWIEGVPLDEAWTLLAPAERERTLVRILEILDALHEHNIVCGDLKPGNVVVGPGGVSLIDLETLREVPDPSLPVVTRDLTPRFAAPEQRLKQATYLASDLWAFGCMGARLAGGDTWGAQVPSAQLRRPWDAIVEACLRPDPLLRPRARDLLWSLRREGPASPMQATVVEEAPPVGQTTERVPEPVAPSVVEEVLLEPSDTTEESRLLLRAYPLPEQLPPASSPTPPLESPAAPPSPRSRQLRWRLALGLLAAGTLFAVSYGIVGSLLDHRRARAESLALREALRRHKTVAAENDARFLDALVERAEAATRLAETPDTLGLLALTTVWQQRWHFESARWNADRYAAGEAVTRRALTSRPAVEALLARAFLQSAACRLAPEAPLRQGACTEARERFTQAERILAQNPDAAWLHVELHWAAEMMEATEAARLRSQGRGDDAGTLAASAVAHCEAAWPDLDAAPVNGVELVEDCVAAASGAGDWAAWFRWTERLIAHDTATQKKLPVKHVSRVFLGAHPSCAEARTERSGVISSRSSSLEDPTVFCATLGYLALGCRDRVPTVVSLAQAWSLPFPEDPPWTEALRAARSAARTSCALR